MFIMSCARAYMLRHAERLLADLARLDSMPPPPFKTEFYRLDIDFKDIMPCHQISAHPPDVHQLSAEREVIPTTTTELQPLIQDLAGDHPDIGPLTDRSQIKVSVSNSISESIEPLNHQEHEIIWSESYQDAEIRLPAGRSLAIVGEYDLWLRKGSISVLGTTIHSSSKLYRVYAPQTHAIPLIKALTNPFGPLLQIAEFRLCSASSGIRQLRKCNSKLSRIWYGGQEIVASFRVVGVSKLLCSLLIVLARS